MRKIPFLLLALFASVPLFAATASEVTVPIVGYVDMPNDLVYRTELVVTNHRDATQYVTLELINDGVARLYRTFPMEPRETKFFRDGSFGTSSSRKSFVGALRVTAMLIPPDNRDSGMRVASAKKSSIQ